MTAPVLQFEPLQALRREFAGFCAGPPPGSSETWLNWAVRETATATLIGVAWITSLQYVLRQA